MLELKPLPGMQTLALQVPDYVREVLLGGARGPGKSWVGMLRVVRYIKYPEYRVLVIRRKGVDLQTWIDRAKAMYTPMGAVFRGGEDAGGQIIFPSGAKVVFGYLDGPRDYERYMGGEFHFALIEEATQIAEEDMFSKLTASVRSTHPDIPAQIWLTANPGGIGHMWVKQRFITPVPTKTIFKSESGVCRVFIPGLVTDNPYLYENDKAYIATLEDLQRTNPALYKAWRFGDWDVFAGQVFSEFKQWEGTKPWHVIPRLPFDVMAKGVKRYIGMDWGFGHDPATLEWIAVVPPNYYGVRHYYVYREMTDIRVEAEEWLKRVADVVVSEPTDGLILPGDAYFHKDQANTIADRMAYELKRAQQFNPSLKIPLLKGVGLSHSERINRQTQLHSLLATQVDGEPGIMITENCRKLIETIPILPFSQTDPETVETKSGVPDHWYDAATYALYYIADQPAPKQPRMSDDDIRNEVYGGYARVDLRPQYDEDEYEKDWRSR